MLLFYVRVHGRCARYRLGLLNSQLPMKHQKNEQPNDNKRQMNAELKKGGQDGRGHLSYETLFLNIKTYEIAFRHISRHFALASGEKVAWIKVRVRVRSKQPLKHWALCLRIT